MKTVFVLKAENVFSRMVSTTWLLYWWNYCCGNTRYTEFTIWANRVWIIPLPPPGVFWPELLASNIYLLMPVIIWIPAFNWEYLLIHISYFVSCSPEGWTWWRSCHSYSSSVSLLLAEWVHRSLLLFDFQSSVCRRGGKQHNNVSGLRF